MPQISRSSNVYVTAFRQRNRILQKDLAEYLGVSRSYISLVESGRSNLSEENIDKIFDNPYHWNTDDLVPAYTRFCQASHYLNVTRNEKRVAEGLPEDLFDIIPPDETDQAIKYGYSDIPVELADEWCSGAPELNREWLLTGKGEMIIEETAKKPTPIEVLQEKVDKLEAAIESLTKVITVALQEMSNK